MNSPVPGSHPVPKSVLHIEGDPTAWGLADVEPQNPPWERAAVALAIIGPLTGTLVLSPARAGTLVLVPPLPGDGWIPALKLVSSYLYVPSTTGLPSASPGFPLAPPDDDLDALQAKIITAMNASSILQVNISAVGGGGLVVLNGAALPFAVLGKAEGNL